MRIHPLCARVCSPAVRRDDVLPRCHEENARSVLPRRRRGALPSSAVPSSSSFFFLFFLNYSIFSFVSCARLSSTELCSSSNEIILTGSSFRLILSPVGRRIFYVSRCARPFSFLSRSTRPRWCESDSTTRKIFPRPSFEFLRTPPFSLSISRTRRGDPLEIVCNNPSEMSFRSRGWTICFHRVSIVFDSIRLENISSLYTLVTGLVSSPSPF